MPTLPHVFRKVLRVCEVFQGLPGPTGFQGLAAQGHAGGHVLVGDPAFTSLPGMELAGAGDLQGLFGLSGPVAQGGASHAEVVALFDQLEVFLQTGQASGRRLPQPGHQLVQFGEQSGIVRIGGKGSLVALPGPIGVAAHVEAGDSQVAPGDGEGGFQAAGLLPQLDGLVVLLLVVEQIAQVVASSGVIRTDGEDVAQDDQFLQAGGEAVIR